MVGGKANAIAPGKRMLSSMTPTIVRRDGRNVLVLGTPGGSTIITTVYQVLLHRVGHGASLAEAVARPRFHHQWTPDRIQVETGRSYDARTFEDLRRRGHEIVARSRIGDVQAIEIDPATGARIGVSDPRGHGQAAGR